MSESQSVIAFSKFSFLKFTLLTIGHKMLQTDFNLAIIFLLDHSMIIILVNTVAYLWLAILKHFEFLSVPSEILATIRISSNLVHCPF